jgi:hypothetical protein
VSGLRPPTVAGVGGGVATTTLAVALHGRDAGRAHEGADILACRGRPDSLRRAAAVLERTGPGPRPVLAVTLDGARAPRGPVRVRLDQLATVVSAVVLLPDVGRWRSIVDPLPEVATLLVAPMEDLPRPLRTYAAALGELAAAVAASGRLDAAPQRAGRAAAPAAVLPDGAVTCRTPQVIGAFQPVVGTVTRVGAPPAGTSRPDALPPDVRRPASLRLERSAAAACPAAPELARRPRGVRIISPARPGAVPISGHGAERRPPGATPSVPVERVEQVG